MNIWMGLLFVALLVLFTGGMIHLILRGKTSRED